MDPTEYGRPLDPWQGTTEPVIEPETAGIGFTVTG
jgi:hypothetical protein